MDNQVKLIHVIKCYVKDTYMLTFNKDISFSKGDILQGMYPDLFNYEVLISLPESTYIVGVIYLKESAKKEDINIDLKEGNIFDSINNPIYDNNN